MSTSDALGTTIQIIQSAFLAGVVIGFVMWFFTGKSR